MTPLQARLVAAAPWTVVTERDLLYIPLPGREVLVVACDSDGGIGPKEADTVPCDATDLGRLAARVPLLEAVAAGATVVAVVDTLSVELEPVGAQIIAGIRAETRSVGLPDHAVTGSTEDNVPTVATGVGVTVLARAPLEGVRPGSARAGDLVCLVGRPKSAPADEVVPADDEIIDVPALTRVMALASVHEALPIGSRGVAHELRALASSAGLAARDLGSWPVAPDASGGPSTAALVALDPAEDPSAAVEDLARAARRPVWPLARLVQP